MIVLLLWGPLLMLALLCVLTLDHLPPQRRRGLFAIFFGLLGLATVLFGGAWMLKQSGLAWRTWFQEGLSFILWLVGLVTGIMTVVYAERWLAERGGFMKNAVTIFAVLCLVSAMCIGTIMGLLWCMGPGEQVITYAGEKVILGRFAWAGDTSYSLYEYHGPLVRGAGPLLVDWDESRIEGAVNVLW